MTLQPGDRVEVVFTMPVVKTGEVVCVIPDDHLPWPKVRVRHDGSVPDPLDLTRQRDTFDWPDWLVRSA